MESKAHLKPAFIRELKRHGNVSRAARAVGIDRRTANHWKQVDADFKEEMQHALKEGREA